MPVKSEIGPGMLFMDGVCIGSISGGIMECSLEPVEPECVVRKIPEMIEITVSVYPKRVSRKKLIKKLMAIGIPRNAANEVARRAREQRIPYYLAPAVIPRPDEWGL